MNVKLFFKELCFSFTLYMTYVLIGGIGFMATERFDAGF